MKVSDVTAECACGHHGAIADEGLAEAVGDEPTMANLGRGYDHIGCPSCAAPEVSVFVGGALMFDCDQLQRCVVADCGAPIPLPRLAAVPGCTRCLQCELDGEMGAEQTPPIPSAVRRCPDCGRPTVCARPRHGGGWYVSCAAYRKFAKKGDPAACAWIRDYTAVGRDPGRGTAVAVAARSVGAEEKWLLPVPVGLAGGRLGDGRLRSSSNVGEELAELAQMAWELRAEKKAVEKKLAAANEALLAALGDRRSLVLGEFVVHKRGRPERLKVVDEGQVPAAWCVMKPDSMRIQRHFVQTGEVLSGTQVVAGKEWVQMRTRR